MPQLSPNAQRVVDPVLTNIAQGFSHNAFVGGALFPRVNVPLRGGNIITFGRKDFMQYGNLLRTPGSNTPRVQFGYSGSTYALADYSIEGQVPYELMQEAQNGPGIDAGALGVYKAMNIIALRLEIAQAALATNASLFGASNKVTLSGGTQWSSATGVPLDAVETAKDAVRAATGKRANTVVMGAAVYKSVRTNPQVRDWLKYTSREATTPELLAEMFGVDRVLIGDAIQATDAGVFSDVWGKFCVVAYTELGSLQNFGNPTFGYTYNLEGYPLAEVPYEDRNAKSWLYPASSCEAPVIAAADAGYLISAAVA
jgi:hypothetical protein